MQWRVGAEQSLEWPSGGRGSSRTDRRDVDEVVVRERAVAWIAPQKPYRPPIPSRITAAVEVPEAPALANTVRAMLAMGMQKKQQTEREKGEVS